MSKAKNQKFLKDLDNYISSMQGTIKQVIQSTIEDVVSELVEQSPLGRPNQPWSEPVRTDRLSSGYKPGRFKASWNVGLDFIPEAGSNQAVDPSGLPSLFNANKAMDKWNFNVDNIYIVNTAVNPDTGEKYPSIIYFRRNTSWDLSYKSNLNQYLPALTYDWQEDASVVSIADVFTKSLEKSAKITK